MTTLWSGRTGCDQYQLTVYFLDLNVVGLRIADGDLLLKFALPKDKTFLECEERKKQHTFKSNYSHVLLLGEYLSELLNEIVTDCNNKEDKCKQQANKKQMALLFKCIKTSNNNQYLVEKWFFGLQLIINQFLITCNAMKYDITFSLSWLDIRRHFQILIMHCSVSRIYTNSVSHSRG